MTVWPCIATHMSIPSTIQTAQSCAYTQASFADPRAQSGSAPSFDALCGTCKQRIGDHRPSSIPHLSAPANLNITPTFSSIPKMPTVVPTQPQATASQTTNPTQSRKIPIKKNKKIKTNTSSSSSISLSSTSPQTPTLTPSTSPSTSSSSSQSQSVRRPPLSHSSSSKFTWFLAFWFLA